jgi:hypothetical protein
VELQVGLESLRKLKQQTATTLAEILLQSVLCLRDGECRSSSLAGPIFDENTRLAGFREGEMDAVLGDYYSVRVQLAYLLGEFDVARELLREGQPYAHTLTAQLQSTNRVLFRALTNIEAARSRRQSLPATVAADLKRMERWSESAPVNFAHTTALLRAEIGHFHGNLETAVTHYAQALSLARQNGFPADEALILERCGRFWQSRGHAELARVYLEKARDAWRARGALALVRRLEREFPDLVSRESGGLEEGISGAALSESSESGSSGHGQIDLGSVLKISRALSSEMDLERLHKRVLEIVLENAGADRGVYVSCEHGRFIVEVEAQLGSQEAIATGGLPLDQYPRVARSVVLYAARMGETVLLNNLAENERFAGDEYLQVEQPGSILALPVMNRSELKGIVYLENHVNREAFTPGLSRVLDVIAGQFAVSLENARLYADLEGRVRERTEQLRATLDQVQALKVRQDGDYYLTAQLMKPFGRIQVDPGRTKVDSLVRQKKRFEFKKWTEEIGGDLCAAQSIRLQGRDCVVFLNGDAMGKSIQGAGGAMVLGSVFQTLLQRSSRSAEVQAMDPGAWLRDAIRELQDVFIGFEGGMFISLVLGIVDNEQGLLYFVTAEHPYTVLYRDQHARFLDTEHRMHKIGNPMTDENAPVFSFPLKPGDVVICGSDGRDDIRLPTGEIAENYEDFLRRVEEGRGNLHEIYSALERQGELIDDLSLLRIEYRHA